MGETPIIVTLILFNIIFIAFLSGIAIFIYQYRIKKRAHLKQISSIDAHHKKELLETQIEIQAQTMQYIGQEIHDNIGQKLTLASIYTQQLIFENKTPEINENIRGINDIINQSLRELRHLSKSLTDDSIKNNSISKLIQNECKKVNDLKKCNVQFSKKIEKTLDSYQVKSILLRITQEFIQNSIKHSNCKNIVISLYISNAIVYLNLRDDGIGFETETIKPKGIGLQNIRKRTELIGGSMLLESSKRSGTKLTLKIPH
ncbi:sensor histidine kinase [Tenacibaculum maritimum]|uniref:Oxygen sensor histidine kinase NreB n=2 Tax=Tenacibaculum maritimum TaxID=107401 RepID=A0A2H1E860_9FLAO|nr:ATP-binding protein [Tenacibaculum maritimum]MCD9580918.1 histidine kinase [Tenacibaculum maritimum]MCD9635580.1 histidine kinase [Tenacibaculum maritimum]CAA0148449.1 Two-component system sensor histidine kinase [Tenacibaculum maritimum]CAA0184315.1 Two-component system sensor histidine kinase [Tenacibaculum maritimum]CAA0199165.1 Two-component system sensor histidine kinase [Tenacibaculum maritimum]